LLAVFVVVIAALRATFFFAGAVFGGTAEDFDVTVVAALALAFFDFAEAVGVAVADLVFVVFVVNL
jgi:hypothetical protein